MAHELKENGKHGLEEYVAKIFNEFKTDRQKELESKWQNNYDAYKKQLDTQWKKGEGGVNEYGTGEKNEKKWRSQRFIGITKQKIVAAHAIIVDTIMQGGQIPFFLSDNDLTEEELAEMPEVDQESHRKNREKMEARMKDQLKRCKCPEKLSELILSSAIYGEAWAKHTVKSINKVKYVPETLEDATGNIWNKEIEVDSYPNFDHISIWDIFRDLETDDLQKGRAIIQRTPISVYELRKLTSSDSFGVITDNVKSVISNQSNKSIENVNSLSPALRDIENRQKKVTMLEYWGRVPAKQLKEFLIDNKMSRIDLDDDDMDKLTENDDDGNDIEVMIWSANNSIIKIIPAEEGKRPFYRHVWDKNKDSLESEGVADNLFQIQSLMNGAVRAFEDNKKLSSNVIMALKARMLINGDQEWVPGTNYHLDEDCDDVRQAIQQVVIQDVGESLLSMINMAEQFADDESSIPRVQQGGGSSGRETAFELSQRLEKSGKYLGKVIRNLDYGIIEPFLTDLYEYNMDTVIDEDIGQGNYKVCANGFTSFQNRVNKLSALRQFLELIQSDPDIREEVNKVEIYKEFAELLDIDVDRFSFNEEDQGLKEKQAQLNAEMEQKLAELEIQKLEAEISLERARAETMVAETKIKAEEQKLRVLEEVNKVNGLSKE